MSKKLKAVSTAFLVYLNFLGYEVHPNGGTKW